MTVSKTLSPARLYVGLGGSGAKTLVEFVKTLVDHQEHGEEAETNMAFVLVDTDVKELRNAEESIRKTFERVATQPLIRSIHTSEGVPNFSAFCANRLEKAKHGQRLQDAWWYDTAHGHDPVPFTAERMKGMADLGAGQCPAVSMFFAWNSLNHIGDVIKSVVDDLKRQITLKSLYQNWVLHMSVVGSLAGGTGRGCWHLVTYKVREVLAQIGRQTSPIGYFYDASIFEDLLHDPARGTKMKINALTGFSELTGWMRNETEKNPFHFRLPNLDRPEDEAADVIDVERIVHAVDGTRVRGGVHGHSPLNEAFMIFQTGKAGTPRDKRYYYQVVANAMYARLIEDIASDASNRAVPLGGLGAASIVVPIAEVRQYVKDYVPAFCAQFLLGSDASRSTPDSEAAWTSETSEEALSHLAADLAAGLRCDDQPVTEPSPDPTAVVMAQVWHRCAGMAKGLLDNLGKRLDQQNYREAARIINQIEGLDRPDAVVSREVNEFIKEDLWGTPGDGGGRVGGRIQRVLEGRRASKADIEQVFGDESEAAPGATARKLTPVGLAFRRVVEASKARYKLADGTDGGFVMMEGYGTKLRLLDMLAEQIATFKTDLAKAEPEGATVETPRTAFERARRGIWPWSRISVDESDEIKEAAGAAVKQKLTTTIYQTVYKWLTQVEKDIQELQAAYRQVVEQLGNYRNKTIETLRLKKQQVFWTKGDFDRLLKADKDDLYHRELLAEQPLKPFYADDKVFADKLAEVAVSEGNRAFAETRDECVAKLGHWIASVLDDGRAADECRRLVDDGIDRLSQSLSIPLKFFRERFGFFEVVKDHVREWGRELKERVKSPHESAVLRKAFDIRFGMDYPYDNDIPRYHDRLAEEVCCNMALSLGQRTDLLYEARRDFGEQRTYDAVTVVLPQEEAFKKGESIVSAIESATTKMPEFARPGTFSVVGYDPNLHAGGNPYLMIAYAHSGFPDWRNDSGINQITSLNYHAEREVHEWLEACEDASGLSWFVEDGAVLPNAGNSFGLGYLSPQFVRDDVMSQLRWRPWLNLRNDEARHRHALDLVAYALLEVPATAEFAELREVHDDQQWRLPLLRFPTAGGADPEESLRIEFTRPIILWDAEDGKRRAHPAAPSGFERRALHVFVEDLKGPELKSLGEALADEAVRYVDEVVGNREFDLRISPKQSLWDMLTTLRDRVVDEVKVVAASSLPAETKVTLTTLLNELQERVLQLRRMSPEALRSHFETIRSHFRR